MLSSMKLCGQLAQLSKKTDICSKYVVSPKNTSSFFTVSNHQKNLEAQDKTRPTSYQQSFSNKCCLKDSKLFLKNAGTGLDTHFQKRNTSVKSAAIGQAVSKDERREFMAVFPDIVRDLTETHRQTEIPDVTKWYSKEAKLFALFLIKELQAK